MLVLKLLPLRYLPPATSVAGLAHCTTKENEKFEGNTQVCMLGWGTKQCIYVTVTCNC